MWLIRLSVYNAVFNVNEGNNQFLYASVSLDDGAPSPLNSGAYKLDAKAAIHSSFLLGACEQADIAELTREEIEVNLIIEED